MAPPNAFARKGKKKRGRKAKKRKRCRWRNDLKNSHEDCLLKRPHLIKRKGGINLPRKREGERARREDMRGVPL